MWSLLQDISTSSNNLVLCAVKVWCALQFRTAITQPLPSDDGSTLVRRSIVQAAWSTTFLALLLALP